MQEEIIYSTQELANALGVQPRTVQRYAQEYPEDVKRVFHGRYQVSSAWILLHRLPGTQISPDPASSESYLARIHELEQQIVERDKIIADLRAQLVDTSSPLPRSKKGSGEYVPLMWVTPTLVSAYSFARHHGIPDSTLIGQVKSGRIHGIKGNWYTGGRPVTLALDQQGMHQVYLLHYERVYFQSCDLCPHALSSKTR